MKKNLSLIIGAFLILASGISQVSFSLPKTQNSKLVLVAIASKQKECGSPAYSTTNDIGMKYVQGSFDYNEQESSLREQLENTYGASGVKIRMRSSRGKVVVIIRYKKSNDCSIWEYAVAGGNDYSAAMESARKSYSIGGTYDVVANITNE